MSEDSNLLLLELAKNLEALNTRVIRIQEDLAERRGERRIIVWAAGLIGGLAANYLPKIAGFLARLA